MQMIPGTSLLCLTSHSVQECQINVKGRILKSQCNSSHLMHLHEMFTEQLTNQPHSKCCTSTCVPLLSQNKLICLHTCRHCPT